MTKSIVYTSWLHALTILISCQSIALTSGADTSSGGLRGLHVERESATSHEGQADEESRRRQLYGREFTQGYDSLTQSHASAPLEQQQGETQAINVTMLSFYQGQPVNFEKQSEEPTTNISTRIVGGGPSAEQRNFCMHMNWDIYSNSYVAAGCGGSLIGNCHVLTAAHCSALSREGMPDAVFCNAYAPFQGNYGRPYHFSTVTNIIKHPGHNMVSNENDIEILQLGTCVPDMTQYPLMKVATPSFLSRLPSGQQLVVSGFGRLSQFDPTQVTALQSVAIPFIPTTECRTYYPGGVYPDMVCAGQPSGGIDACQGDSGGPLFYQGPGGGDTDQTIVGVVSWGGGCAQPMLPGVYASVAYFYDWIKNLVCSDYRTDQSIALCTPVVTYSLTSVSTSLSRTCATLYQSCDTSSCCSGYVCTAGAAGYAPTCIAPASTRSSFSAVRGGMAFGGGD